jgi:nucleoside-diphosphate-sugar epimerase
MVHILIIGASSWIAKKLVDSLIENGGFGNYRVTHLTLADVAEPDIPSESNNMSINALSVDKTNSSHMSTLLESLPQFIFHLTAMTDQFAADVEVGFAVILEESFLLLDTMRKLGDYKPRLVFASSMDCYHPPQRIANQANTSSTSQTTQKAIEELLEDSTRKGVLTATSIRLPIIVIRPDTSDTVAYSYLSSILCDAWQGKGTELSISKQSLFTIASCRAAVGCLLHAALYEPVLPTDRILIMPGISLTVEQMINTLDRVAGKEVAQRIRYASTEMECGSNLPLNIDTQRARELGFPSDESFDDILLPGTVREREGLPLESSSVNK